MSISQQVFLLEPLLHDPQRITGNGLHDRGGFRPLNTLRSRLKLVA